MLVFGGFEEAASPVHFIQAFKRALEYGVQILRTAYRGRIPVGGISLATPEDQMIRHTHAILMSKFHVKCKTTVKSGSWRTSHPLPNLRASYNNTKLSPNRL